MVDALGDEFEFRIVTGDRDLFDMEPYAGIDIGSWNRVGKAWVYYIPEKKASYWKWKSLINCTPHDVIYFNSLFDLRFTLMPLLAIKLMKASRKLLVIAPRGELSPGAIALKGWKKRPFLFVSRLFSFYHNVLWHASTEDEANVIRNNLGDSCNVSIAVNVPTIVPSSNKVMAKEPMPDGSLRIVFLSRISRKKNLDYALRILARSKVKLRFDIWGTQEDASYWQICQKLIDDMPANVKVRYCGEVSPAEVVGLLAGYDLFFLPTLGENYGHVIAEAVSAGTPLLISNQTPWNGLAKQGVGWDLPLDEDGSGFLQALQESSGKTDAERDQWRMRVLKYAEVRLSTPSIIDANRQLFSKAVQKNKATDSLQKI